MNQWKMRNLQISSKNMSKRLYFSPLMSLLITPKNSNLFTKSMELAILCFPLYFIDRQYSMWNHSTLCMLSNLSIVIEYSKVIVEKREVQIPKTLYFFILILYKTFCIVYFYLSDVNNYRFVNFVNTTEQQLPQHER